MGFVRRIVGGSAFVALAVAGAAPSSADDEGRWPAACEREAVRLIDATPLFRSAADDGPSFETLGSGRFVYLCEVRRGFVRVVFPRVGERVDCTARAEADACPSGWARKPIRTEILG